MDRQFYCSPDKYISNFFHYMTIINMEGAISGKYSKYDDLRGD